MSDELRYFLLRSGCDVPHAEGTLSALTSKLILTGLADHADYEHKLYVSYRGLARELDLSPSTTFVAYKLYEAQGVLQRTGKRRGEGGCTEFRLNLDSLTAKNPSYYLPTALSSQATSERVSDSVTASRTALPSDSTSALPSDSNTQARNRNPNSSRYVNETHSEPRLISELVSQPNPHVEALFRLALEIELKYVPSKMPFDYFVGRKQGKYLPVCREVLKRYPLAQPATQPDHDLALLVCELTNPKVPALQLSAAGKRELERRYCTLAADKPSELPAPSTP